MCGGLDKSNNLPCYEANIRWATSIGDERNYLEWKFRLETSATTISSKLFLSGVQTDVRIEF